MLNGNFVIVGILVNLLGNTSYVVDMFRGKAQPNRVSWGLWALAPLIAFVAELKQGVGIQSLLTLNVAFFPAIVFLLSFFIKKSYWKLEKLDIICGILSLFGLLLWYITQVGNIAIFFSIIADALASFPTLVKAYKYPETENAIAYFGSAIAGMITLLTITKWDFQDFGYPLYIALMMGAIALCVQFKIKKLIS